MSAIVGLAPHAAEIAGHAEAAHLVVALVAVARQEAHEGQAFGLADLQRLALADVLGIGAEIHVAEPVGETRRGGAHQHRRAEHNLVDKPHRRLRKTDIGKSAAAG